MSQIKFKLLVWRTGYANGRTSCNVIDQKEYFPLASIYFVGVE